MTRILPSVDDARSIALGGANEDYCGLYEVLWELNSKFPTDSDDAHLAVARTAVEQLVREGVVGLFAAEWAKDAFAPVASDEALSLLSQSDSWRVGKRYYCIAASGNHESQPSAT
jgi:hypothetical protein